MKVRFSKVYNDHNRLRTDVIEGECEALPRVGECFEMTGAPLDKWLQGATRFVNTSQVHTIIEFDNGMMHIHTESGSIYKIEILG